MSRTLALYLGGCQQYIRWEPRGRGGDDVMDDSTGLGCYDTDRPRIHRQGPLPGSVEQSLRLESPLELLIRQVEVTDTRPAHGLDDELIGTPLNVHVHASERHDLHVVHGFEVHPCPGAGEQDAPYLAPLVLQGEIVVSGRVLLQIGYLPADPDVVQSRIGIEQVLDTCVQLGDGYRLGHGR